MKPSEVATLLFIYIGNRDFDVELLVAEGLIERAQDPANPFAIGWQATDRGAEFCAAVRRLPLPVSEIRWVMPKGE